VLKQRVATALVLAPLALWGMLGLSAIWLGSIFGIIVLIGAWEWARLIGLSATMARVSYVVLLAIVMALFLLLEATFENLVIGALIAAAVWWVIGAIMVLTYQGVTGVKTKDMVFGAIVGGFVLLPTWLALRQIHSFSEIGSYLLVFLMLLIWAADVGAYFSGRQWGKRKLAPKVSPGKTIEGAFGALAASALVGLVGGVLFGVPAEKMIWFIPFCMIVVVFSIMGDLLESLFKRRVGVKDSGHLLPGHGGKTMRWLP
jgi:phosphatidate cytidylyltransferase